MFESGIPLLRSSKRAPETILVNVTPQETRVAILEDETICEIHIEHGEGCALVGNIYLGVVRRVLPGMQSAFIDIGLEKAAFLHVVDLIEQRKNTASHCRIEHLLFEGQNILVQVTKDPINNKGARLSTQISLAGRYLVYLPHDEHIGISQRIENEAERVSLKQRLEALLPNPTGGYIIRTSAESASDSELLADIDYLHRVWDNIRQSAKVARAQSVLYQDLALNLRVLRDMFSDNTAQILVDSKHHSQQMRDFAERYVPRAVARIQLHDSDAPLFECYQIDQAINNALEVRVNLNAGGYLIIESTEAMTTIDVNTGGFVGAKNFDETIFKTNLEACHAIARELRLRNLGGIIIIDFIDMAHEKHRAAVLNELSSALANDRTRVTLNGFTSLGLVEITRKRTRESLSHVLSEVCTTCKGRGRVKTAQTVCYEIHRQLLREAKNVQVAEFRILASSAVINLFLNEEAPALAELSTYINTPISLSLEPHYAQEAFDIITIPHQTNIP